MIDRNALVSDLAKAYGVRVDVDDPILVAALLNRRLLDEAIAAMEAAVRASADRMTAASVQQTDAARQTAGLLITQAGEWSADRLRLAARDVSASMINEVRAMIAQADRSRRIAVRAATIAVCVPALGLSAFLGYWLAGMMRG